MDIGFCKVGKSIKFKRKNYSPVGGDNEASCVLRALANNNPDKTFYIVGRSDYNTLDPKEKHELFPYGNVIDIWEGRTAKGNGEAHYTYIVDYLKNNNINLATTVMMMGQIGNVTIPNKIEKIRETESGWAAVIDMTRGYTTPISVWLNECRPHYIEITNDPRYVMNQSRDMMHMPAISLGQYDYTYTANTITSYADQKNRIIHNVDSIYAGMETAFCIDYDYTKDVNFDRNVDFMVVLNEGKPSRYKMLKEWVLDHNDDVEIYGKWDEAYTENDSRFKGSIHISDLQQKLNNVKFTFIIPIKEGWVTSKYIEMIHAGVIPFLHPTYDDQNHTGIPDFLRPKTPQEMAERIKMLSESQSKYKTVLRGLRNLILKPEFYNGTYINNQIMTAFDKNYIAPDLNNFQKQNEPTVGLEEFFG